MEEQVAESVEPAAPSGEDWRAGLPDDIKDHQALANIADVGTLAKTMIHAQSMVGAEKIAVPGKWATDDDWSDVYNKLGRPEDANGYELTFGDVEVDQEFVGAFKEVAHESGLTPRQAEKLAAWYMDVTESVAQSPEQLEADVATAKADAEAELRKEYGRAFDERLQFGDNMVGEFGAEGLLDLRLEDGTPLANHPAFIKTMISAGQYIHESISEDKLVGDRTSGAITPAEADQQITQLMRPDSPYWDAGHPMHESHVQQVYQLQQQKWPEENE